MSWCSACPLEAVAPGRAHMVEVSGRNSPSATPAMASMSSITSAPMTGAHWARTLDGHQIECPRHGARFDVTTGKVMRLPAVRPIRSYPTRVVGGEVEVELED